MESVCFKILYSLGTKHKKGACKVKLKPGRKVVSASYYAACELDCGVENRHVVDTVIPKYLQPILELS